MPDTPHTTAPTWDYYLAGPMSDHEDLNEAAFMEVAARIRRNGRTVFVPHEHERHEDSWSRIILADLVQYMPRISQDGGVLLLPGWRTAPACLLEVAHGVLHRLPIWEQTTWEQLFNPYTDDPRQFLKQLLNCTPLNTTAVA